VTYRLDVRSNIADVQRGLNDLQRKQLPFATALALTRTAQDIKPVQVRVMQRVFDKPTRYTLNSLQVKPATKRDLTAEVGYKEFGNLPASNYIRPHVDGGGRRQKRSERALTIRGLMGNKGYWVPGAGARLNANGNITGGQMNKILTGLSASTDGHQNITERSRRRTNRRGHRYFVPKPGSKLAAGVYKETDRKIEPVLIFVSNVRYNKRYPFNEVSQRVAKSRFPVRFAEALEYAVATAMARAQQKRVR